MGAFIRSRACRAREKGSMQQLPGIAAFVFLLASATATAQGDAGRGRDYYRSCTACHGAEAEGNPALGAPRLSHLAPAYLVAQLEKFKAGIRGGEGSGPTARQMQPMAAGLVDRQAMLDVAAFIDSLPERQPDTRPQGDARLGGDYFNQFCGACHGPAAEGNPALQSPALAGANDWYLAGQLRAFRDGSRGSHPDDRTGRQMRAMAVLLPDEQAILDVVAFIASLGQ